MTRNTLGFLLAPLAAPTVFLLVMLVRGTHADGGSDQSLFWLFALGVMVAYVVTAALGLPLHLLLRRSGCQGCGFYMIGGALIALVPFLPGLLSGKELTQSEFLLLVGSVLAVGLITGLLFWWIAIRGGKDGASVAVGDK